MSTSPSPRTNDANGLLDQIRQGNSLQQKTAIDRLMAMADEANDEGLWNNAAIGLTHLRRFDEAIDILIQLVQKFPSQDDYRLNLAFVYGQAECFDLCRFHLECLVGNGAEQENRKLAAEQIAAYDAFLGLGEGDLQLQDRQWDFLEECIGLEPAVPRNYIELSRLIMHAGKSQPGAEMFSQATELLEQGWAACTDRREILENLCFSYLHADPKRRMNAVVKELEALAPDSPILETLAEAFRGLSPSNALGTRVDMLMQQVGSQNEGQSEAAIRDLARIVDVYSDTVSYRLRYAFCLGVTGRSEEAARQAERLEQVESREHSFHFNLGQVFWFSGNAERGRRHLLLATEYATSDRERQDAEDRIHELEAAR